jgi:hypothetical protein
VVWRNVKRSQSCLFRGLRHCAKVLDARRAALIPF